MLLSLFYILLGLALLIFGGDWLVDGAVGVARRFRLSPMVIGLTIVAFGTSAPELLVSVQSALGGNPGIALGNVAGSNIANIALILGVTALIRPIPVQGTTTRIDAPVLFISTLALTGIVAAGWSLSRPVGLIALAALGTFVTYQVRSSRKAAANAQQANVVGHSETMETAETVETTPDDEAIVPIWKSLALLAVGIAALKFGAQSLVGGAVDIAAGLGVSDRVIGLTIVAIGTSLPELFASLIAARRGNVDLAVGNVVGSNLFNILCVLGAACTVCPIDAEALAGGFLTDCLWMIGLTLLIWIQLRTDYRLTRTEGALLLAAYVAFLTMALL